jgi:hypothetical protein
MSSRYGSHALAAGARPGRSSDAASGDAKSVVDPLAGFADADAGSVVDPLAGFADADADAGSVVDPLAGLGGRLVRGGRTAIPAAFRYELAVSRRTPVASSIRRSDHFSCPSARTCCFLSSLKTFTLGGGPWPCRRRQRLAPALQLAGFQVSITGRFWVSTEGGSNGYRSRVWKQQLQRLADKLSISIHVSHFPPGTSEWNKVEHRLFSFITMNWRGRPLRTFETVVNLISDTTNRGGLVVRARLDRRKFPIGKKVSAKEFRALKIEPDDFHGDWNYVIRPRAESA